MSTSSWLISSAQLIAFLATWLWHILCPLWENLTPTEQPSNTQCLDFFNSRQLVQVNLCIAALFLYFSALLKWTSESQKSFIPLSIGIGFPHQCRTHDVLWKHHISLAPSSTLGTLRLPGQVKLLQGRCLREVRAPQISFFSPAGAQEGLAGKLHMNMALSGQDFGQEKQHHPTRCVSFQCRQKNQGATLQISLSTTNLRNAFPQ